MATPSSICNQALLLLGQKTIQSLDEETKEAAACKAFYDDTRDHCLRDMKPNFATHRVKLTAANPTPAWGFDYAWALPQDYMCVVQLDMQTLQDRQYRNWRVEGLSFLTDRFEPNIRYVQRIDGVESRMDSSFVKTMAAFIAYEIGYALTESTEKVASMFDLFVQRREDAYGIYGQESSTVELTNEQLTQVR